MANPTVNWATRVITIPQSFLTPLGGSNYELDSDAFRLVLKDIEDDEGMPFPDTHRHNTTITLGGVVYARAIEIINEYTVTFENGSYAVSIVGSNNNILDVTNLNSVSVRSNNSAGLQVVSVGSGLSTEEHDQLMATAVEDSGRLADVENDVATLGGKIDIIDAETDKIQGVADSVGVVSADVTTIGADVVALGVDIDFIKQIEGGRWRIVNNQMVFYEADNTTEIARFNLFDATGNPAMTSVFERKRA